MRTLTLILYCVAVVCSHNNTFTTQPTRTVVTEAALTTESEITETAVTESAVTNESAVVESTLITESTLNNESSLNNESTITTESAVVESTLITESALTTESSLNNESTVNNESTPNDSTAPADQPGCHGTHEGFFYSSTDTVSISVARGGGHVMNVTCQGVTQDTRTNETRVEVPYDLVDSDCATLTVRLSPLDGSGATPLDVEVLDEGLLTWQVYYTTFTLPASPLRVDVTAAPTVRPQE
jgi:hypothetical protein